MGAEGCQGSRGRRERGRGHRDRNRSSMRRALSDLDVFFEKTLSPVISRNGAGTRRWTVGVHGTPATPPCGAATLLARPQPNRNHRAQSFFEKNV